MALFNENTPIDNPDDLPDDGQDHKLEDYMGEGKKYKTPADVAKALAAKDTFIEQLKSENKLTRTAAEKLQDELKTRKTLQEFLDQMNSRTDSPPPAKEPNTQGENDTTLNTDAIQRIVEQTISQRSAAQREQENLDFVQQKLIEIYGPSYERNLRDRTRELGMTEAELTAMAMKTPKVFLTLVAPANAPSKSLFSPPASSVNSESFKPRSDAKTWSYYENMRKTDPSRYFSPIIHNEMMAQLTNLGEDDFYK